MRENALAELAQADQPARPEHAGLHHQHQRGAAGDRPHGGIVGVEQRDRLVSEAGSASSNGVMAPPRRRNAAHEPCGKLLFHLLGLGLQHRLAQAAELSGQRRVDLIAMMVSPPASVSRVDAVAVKRPTMPSGVPSTLASISSGGVISVTSTPTLNLKRR